MSTLLWLLLLLLLGGGLPVEAVTRYTDQSGGSDSNGCSTNPAQAKGSIAGGISCMNSGDRLLIKPGIYQEVIDMVNIPAGNPGAPTILEAESPGTAIVQWGPGVGHVDTLFPMFEDSIHDIEFRGLVIDGQFQVEWCIMASTPPSSFPARITFQDTEIHSCKGQSGFGHWPDFQLLRNHVHNTAWRPTGATIYDRTTCGEWVCGEDQEYKDQYRCHTYCHAYYTYNTGALFEDEHHHDHDGRAYHHYGSVAIIRNARTHTNGGPGIDLLGSPSVAYNNESLCNWSGISSNPGNTMVHNTIDGCGTGGGISHWSCCSDIIQNNLILNTSGNPIEGGGSGLQGNLSDTGGGSGYTLIPDSPSPVIAETGPSGNYHLTPNSAARDASPSAGSTYALDKDGEARSTFGTVDTGAYVFAANGGPPVGNTNPIYVSPTGPQRADCVIPESSSTPTTLVHGLECMIAGKTLILQAGTYNAGIDTGVTPIPGGTGAATRTVIKGAPGAPAILRFLRFRSASNNQWWQIENLTIDALGLAETSALSLESGSQYLLTNLTVRNAAHQLLAIFLNTGTVELRDSMLTTAGFECVAVSGGSGTVTLVHNTISQCQGPAIVGYETPATLVVSRNILHQTGLAFPEAAVHLEGMSNTSVVNNVIHSSQAGIRLMSTTTGTTFQHNTVVGMTNFGLQCDAGAAGTSATNNISVGNGSSVANNCGAALSGNIQTGSPATIFVNPGAHDYHLVAGSPAIGAGVNLPAVPTDLEGTARPQGGSWDAGAYEFVPTAGPASATITTPTSDPTYSTTVTPLTSVGGTASDDTGVLSVTWTCPTCTPASGTATCATCGAAVTSVTWSIATLGLATGANVLTVTPQDASGPGTADTLTVTKSDPPVTPPAGGGPQAVLFFY